MLTRFEKGSIREVLAVSFPLFLSILSSCVMSFCDRYFISKYSLEAFVGIGYGGYLALLLQALCIKITSINQIFVSSSIGENKTKEVGSYTWQMIWFSIFSSLIVIPIGLMIRPLYFSEGPAQLYGSEYFTLLLFGNCLFALGGAFSGFQSGIGKTKLLATTALISNIFNLFLSYLLIFGIEGILSPMGVRGAAYGTLISQGLSCLILFISFINGLNRESYGSALWHFSPTLSWKLLKLGTPRAVTRTINLFYWVLAVKLLGNLEGDYLLVLTYGGTLWFVMSSITEGLGKGMISIFSYFIGSRDWEFVTKSFRSGFFVLLISFITISTFILFFSDFLINTMINDFRSTETFHTLKLASIWICGYFFLEGVTYLGVSLLVGMKNTLFAMKFNLLTGCLTIFLPYYICFRLFSCGADKIWMANWICCIVAGSAYFIKAFSIRKKELLVQQQIRGITKNL